VILWTESLYLGGFGFLFILFLWVLGLFVVWDDFGKVILAQGPLRESKSIFLFAYRDSWAEVTTDWAAESSRWGTSSMSLCVLPGGWGSWFFRRVDFSFFGGSFFLLFVFWILLYFLNFFWVLLSFLFCQASTRKFLLASFVAPRYEGVLHQFCDSTVMMLVHSGIRTFHSWLPLDSIHSTV